MTAGMDGRRNRWWPASLIFWRTASHKEVPAGLTHHDGQMGGLVPEVHLTNGSSGPQPRFRLHRAKLQSGSLNLTPDIYRIVSSKSLESSGDVIKPSGGETILVAPTADDGGAKQGGKCC